MAATFSILLDTNVLIPFEDSATPLPAHYARLDSLAKTHGHKLLAHPATLTDIARDKNLTRQQSTHSRILRYPLLHSDLRKFPEIDLTKLDNDQVDDEILHALERNAVSFLVTEDRLIHKKAAQLNLADRVLYVQQAVSLLERLYDVARVTLPNIQEVPVYTLDVKDPFFDSLRAGYTNFDDWFAKCCNQGRSAWTYRLASKTEAICIYNREPSTELEPFYKTNGQLLKLCTFKVGENVRGRKIGELFLKASFQYAMMNGLSAVYLTMYPEQDVLKDLCAKFGFQDIGTKGREQIMLKEIPSVPPESPLRGLDYHIRYSPCFKVDAQRRTFVIPIQPQYHGALFPEIRAQLQFFSDPTIGNGIIQAYLCHANIREIGPGDVILFYRSTDEQSITTVAIVEQAFKSTDTNAIIQHVAKRTVYTAKEIEQMAQSKVRVILFRLAFHLKKPISKERLISLGILKGSPQTIQSLSIDAFKKFTQDVGIQSCVFTN